MSNQLVITSGAKVRNLEGVLTGTSGVVNSVPLGAANGVATLDSGGKVPVSQLPSSVVTYLGTWDAATNTPTLTNGVGDAGDMYICNVAGTVNFGAGPVTFAVGDWVLYGSGTWQKSSGQNGTVTSVGASITGNAIGLTGSPITTAGTLAFAFAGTSGQYVNGAGNLVTFPTTIAQAQRLITEVYNETGATLTKGTVVYINGGHGNLPTVTKAIATGDSTSAQTYGVVQTDITDNNNGYVVVLGSLGDLDTQAYPNGTQLYLSSTTAGAWTSTKQYAPAHLVYVGIVVRSHPTQGVVEVRIQNGFELDELHNVSAQNPLNNQGLFYNTSTSLWENKSIATALGYTPANDASVVHLTGNETIAGIKTFSDSLIANQSLNLKILASGTLFQNGYSVLSSLQGYLNITQSISSGFLKAFSFDFSSWANNSSYNYILPAANGTLALTSDIPSLAGYVTLATTQTITGAKTFSGYTTFTSTVELTSGLTFSNSGFTLLLQPPTLGVNRTVTLPNGTGTLALTSDIPSLSATAPISYSSGVISISQATTSTNGYLSSTDWNTFNGKQAQINGTGFVKASGTTISYDNSTYALDSDVVKLTGNQTIGGTKTFSLATKNNSGILLSDTSSTAASSGYISLAGYNYLTNRGLLINLASQTYLFLFNTAAGNSYTFPNATGTVALTSDISYPVTSVFGRTGAVVATEGDYSLTQLSDVTITSPSSGQVLRYNGTSWENSTESYVGTVTSVGLSSATSGVTIGSSPITTSGTITLAIATASGSQQGLLSSTDWTTFNNKQNALTNPVTGTGTTNYLPKFTAGTTIGNSLVQDNGSTVSIITGSTVLSLDRTGGATALIELKTGGTVRSYLGADTSMPFVFFNQAASPLMYLNASGNLGLGVTPSAWGSILNVNQFGNYGAFIAGRSDSVNQVFIGVNAYYNGTSWLYSNNSTASRYYQDNGKHIWDTAPSGTAGNAISFTQAMTLFSTGNLAVGTTTDAGYKLDVNGTGRFSGALTYPKFIMSGGSDQSELTNSVNNDFKLTNSGNFRIINNTNTVALLTITNAGAATFSSSVTATGGLISNGGSIGYGGGELGFGVTTSGATSGIYTLATGSPVLYFDHRATGNTGFWVWRSGTGGGTTALTLSNTGAATFSSSVTAGDDITISKTSANLRLFITNTTATTGRSWYFNSYSNGNLYVGNTTAGDIFNFSSTGAATFSSSVTANGIITVNEDGAGTKVLTLRSNWAGVDPAINVTTNNSLLLMTNNTERMRITSGGNVLIGDTTDYSYKLYVNGGSSNGMLFYSTSAANQIKAAGTAPAITFSNTITSPTIGGSLGACTAANQFLTGTAAGDMILINQFTGNKLYITNYSGGVYLTQGATSWTANSDIRLKNINSYIENAVEKLSTLQTINFSYKDDKTNKQNLGLIAQEVEKIFPELIDKNGDGMLGVRYTELVPVLIKAVQELKLEIETLKNK